MAPRSSPEAASSHSSEIDGRPLVSVVVPMYNEGPVVERNLAAICEQMRQLEHAYRWELIVVDDGSGDATGASADLFANMRANVRVFHHAANGGLGLALRTGFAQARGRYIVTLDADLSYGPEHIERLLQKIESSGASIVIASPYMSGGTANNVPRLRLFLSRYANRFLRLLTSAEISTFTCMVRAYDGEFIRSINLSELGAEINPRIIHKAHILNKAICEIPARLSWPEERRAQSRSSYGKLLRETGSVLLSGFMLRPHLYFVIPGVLLMGLCLYAGFWATAHVFEQHSALAAAGLNHGYDDAVAAAFVHYPHVFFIGAMSLALAIQFIGLAVLSLQSKMHFDELYRLNSSIYDSQQPKQKLSVRSLR
ncbi:MAG: glycosyltransferase family 2 protein [Vulcanimicrobiaceae bacterium]